jgi:hypothetical protein
MTHQVSFGQRGGRLDGSTGKRGEEAVKEVESERDLGGGGGGGRGGLKEMDDDCGIEDEGAVSSQSDRDGSHTLSEISFMWRKEELDLVQFTYLKAPIYIRDIDFNASLKMDFKALIDEGEAGKSSPSNPPPPPNSGPSHRHLNPNSILSDHTDSLFSMTYVTFTDENVQREIEIDIPGNAQHLKGEYEHI